MFEAATWRKSARSQNGSACVEIAREGDLVGVRDSKDPAGPVLAFPATEFAAFIEGVHQGGFDRLT